MNEFINQKSTWKHNLNDVKILNFNFHHYLQETIDN